MKIKVVNVVGAKNITLNKVYDVISQTETAFVINNDLNRHGEYLKPRFEIVPEVAATPTYQIGEMLFASDNTEFQIIGDDTYFNIVACADGKLEGSFIKYVNGQAIPHSDMLRCLPDFNLSKQE